LRSVHAGHYDRPDPGVATPTEHHTTEPPTD
jgi:hypothetical protein